MYIKIRNDDVKFIIRMCVQIIDMTTSTILANGRLLSNIGIMSCISRRFDAFCKHNDTILSKDYKRIVEY